MLLKFYLVKNVFFLNFNKRANLKNIIISKSHNQLIINTKITPSKESQKAKQSPKAQKMLSSLWGKVRR